MNDSHLGYSFGLTTTAPLLWWPVLGTWLLPTLDSCCPWPINRPYG
jgi:hypothetical protein